MRTEDKMIKEHLRNKNELIKEQHKIIAELRAQIDS
jgi:hypothetical protein